MAESHSYGLWQALMGCFYGLYRGGHPSLALRDDINFFGLVIKSGVHGGAEDIDIWGAV